MSAGDLRLLFRRPFLASTVPLCYIWAALSFGYGGFTIWLPHLLQSKNITGNSVYESFMLMALAEVPANLLAVALVDRLGRRRLLSLSLILCAGATQLFALTTSRELVVVGSMAIYAGVVMSYATIYLYTPEVFPTPLRCCASGVVRMASSLGQMLTAPAGALMLQAGTSVPLFAYGALLLVAGMLAYVLPVETAHETLSDTLYTKGQLLHPNEYPTDSGTDSGRESLGQGEAYEGIRVRSSTHNDQNMGQIAFSNNV